MHRLAGATLIFFALPSAARAQSVEVIGARALGMAGAFTAVADDATAVHWNPAGLASGAFASLVLDHQASSMPRVARPDDPTAATKGTLVAVAMPAAGLGYYRVAREANPAEAIDGSHPASRVSSLVTHNLALALVHSLSSRLVVGGTVRYVRASVGAATTQAAGPPPQRAGPRPASGRTTHALDADLGLMASLGWLRMGLTARNLSAPVFDTPSGDPVRLHRRLRAGVAVVSTARWQVALDADLTRSPGADADRRVALGAERWLADGRFGLRGGVRARAAGFASPVAAAGLSVGLRRGVWIDVHAASGARPGGLTWGVAGRAGF